MNTKGSVLVIVIWISLSAINVEAQCVFTKSIGYQEYYSVMNNEYPQNYRAGTNCKWIIEGPVGSKIMVRCSDYNIACSNNIMNFYTTGYESTTVVNKCGVGVIETTWDSNRLTMELKAYTGTGRFNCQTFAMASEVPPVTNPPSTACDCGWRQQRRIVGGVQTGVNEFPFMAGLVDTDRRFIFCGGAIISQLFVLTAAHCVGYTSKVGVLVGDHDITTGTDTSFAAIYEVATMDRHVGYNNVSQINDIAVVQTKTKILFSLSVGPVCLPYNFNQYDGFYDVVAIGWGTTQFSGPASDILLKVTLRTVNSYQCQTSLMTTITDGQVCTFASGKDSCQYDSGGPIVWFDNAVQRYKLVGLVSYGRACASGTPSVNTRVSQYEDFIYLYTANNFNDGYCVK